MRSPLICGLTLLACFAFQPSTRASELYVYHRDGWGEAGALEVNLETAIGTREARPFGDKGVEGCARLRFRPTDRVQLEAWGGTLFDEGAYRSASFSLRAGVSVLNQDTQLVDLTIGAGYRFDFTQVSVPELRVTASRSWNALDVTATGILEKPLAEGRDPVDVILGIAVSYQIAPPVAVGVEIFGEDLEGFWVEEEAEGGARLVAGPTVRWQTTEALSIKANAGAVLQATYQGAGVPDSAPLETGMLGRVVVAYAF